MNDKNDPTQDAPTRRRVLTVLAAAPAFAACAVATVDLPGDNQDPDYDGSLDDPNDTGEPPPDDTGTVVDDTGSGGGTQDSGTTAKDSGTTAADTGSGGACTGLGTLVGAVSSLAVGSYKKVGSAFVGHDSKGFWAVKSICTHNNSCQLRTPTASGITCPCHSAAFTTDGAVTKGPASRALANLKITVCNGNVYIDATKTVAAGTRVS